MFIQPGRLAAFLLTIVPVVFASHAQAARPDASKPSPQTQGPCDIYAAANTPCVAAHSTTRALYATYNGPLYRVLRQSDATSLDIQVMRTGSGASHDAGGYADAAAQDRFCADTYCWITKIYDQSPQHNDLTQAPRGGFSGPAMGGYNNLPLANMAPITVMGHKVYGVFIAPGTGLRNNDPKGTAVDDQAEGQYWVINGHHFNGGCCFDYGNAEIDSHDDDNGTMETAYYGDSPDWIHGNMPGPWIMTDQENNLVGCVNTDDSLLCPHLPDIKWRFVTAMAKGEPHRWASLGGDAQRGPLSVMFDGQRVNSSYDPMRKQGAILLGNGGDNSNSSQGTFYEGAMTAANTFPTDATDQLVQANVTAAGYEAPRLSFATGGSIETSEVQTFSPGQAREITVTFTNTGASPVSSLTLELALPGKQWRAVAKGTTQNAKSFSEQIEPGASVSAIFTITAGPKAFNGDLIANASWVGAPGHDMAHETAVQKVRSAAPVKINEFQVGSESAGNATDSFIELYNAGKTEVDLSGWSLTARPTKQTTSSAIEIPKGTKLGANSFYLFGLSNSGTVAPTAGGDATLYVRSVEGMSAGDAISIDTGARIEKRTIAAIGTPASEPTTVWQPEPEGPMVVSAGATHIPVESVAGFKVGEKIALGYGAASPFIGLSREQYEIATVTAVGTAGVQAYLAEDAAAGSSNLKVTSVSDIAVGDKIRLDIVSAGHGIDTVSVTRVGTKASQTNLTEDVQKDSRLIRIRSAEGFAVGDRITVGTPRSREVVTVQSIGSGSKKGAEISITPSLLRAHGRDEWVVAPGSGIDIASPLRFSHAANLPFSNSGTGITFAPATRFPHLSNEPVQALGSGVTLDHGLSSSHAIHTAVLDEKVLRAGYQGLKPNQWFGGPELTTHTLLFGKMIHVRAGALILRDASGLVVDSLNYGGMVDSWAAEGYQAKSGPREEGCFVRLPNNRDEPVPNESAKEQRSASRFPDGADTDSNCADFHTDHPTPGAANASVHGEGEGAQP